jgi:hypothetical protein
MSMSAPPGIPLGDRGANAINVIRNGMVSNQFSKSHHSASLLTTRYCSLVRLKRTTQNFVARI